MYLSPLCSFAYCRVVPCAVFSCVILGTPVYSSLFSLVVYFWFLVFEFLVIRASMFKYHYFSNKAASFSSLLFFESGVLVLILSATQRHHEALVIDEVSEPINDHMIIFYNEHQFLITVSHTFYVYLQAIKTSQPLGANSSHLNT